MCCYQNFYRQNWVHVGNYPNHILYNNYSNMYKNVITNYLKILNPATNQWVMWNGQKIVPFNEKVFLCNGPVLMGVCMETPKLPGQRSKYLNYRREVEEDYYSYRQYLEIFKCLNAGYNWIKVNFSEGFSLSARLDSIAPDITTGFVRRKNITLICDGNTLETKEQAQGCLNKLVQVKLPNGIVLRIYLTHFDENYIGGNIVTSDLLALSEKVTNIECSPEPI